MYGWRGKSGIVIPSNNVVLESELGQLLPSGMTAHYSRVLATGSDPDALLTMSTEADRAIDELDATHVDVFLYACVSTSLVRGPAWDDEFGTRTTSRTGRPCFTAAEASAQAIRAVGAPNVGLVTPFPTDIHRLVPLFLAEWGIDVTAHATHDISDIDEVCLRDPGETYRLARSLVGEFDAVLILATDLRTIDVIEALEQDMGVPVVTTNQALAWMAMKSLGVRAPRENYGALLADLPDLIETASPAHH